MCFSTEASFTASALLAVTGGLTLKNITQRSQTFLALIPLLFAMQQFAEGIVWYQLEHNLISTPLFLNAQKGFLFFAFLIWPIWIPLSLAVVEQVPWRRLLLFFILMCGIILSSMNFYYGMRNDISVHVVYHSLQYTGNVPDQTWIYPLIVLLPCFISSLKHIGLFGFLVGISYLIAMYFYSSTFVSVWCFFAAIVSLSIYKILKDNSYRRYGSSF